MPKSARTEVVGVRFTPEERELAEQLAKRMGDVSLSDCIRSATKMYAKLRLDSHYAKKYWQPFLLELVRSGEVAEMDLSSEDPPAPRRQRKD
jgi:hypothetical protein